MFHRLKNVLVKFIKKDVEEKFEFTFCAFFNGHEVAGKQVPLNVYYVNRKFDRVEIDFPDEIGDRERWKLLGGVSEILNAMDDEMVGGMAPAEPEEEWVIR